MDFCESHTLIVLTAAKEQATLYLVNPQTRGVLFTAIEANVFKVRCGLYQCKFLTSERSRRPMQHATLQGMCSKMTAR